MAPLPDSSTNRLFVDYTDGINNHTLMFRYPLSGTLAGVMGVADDVLSAVSPLIHLITITSARAAAAGSEISLPVAWTGLGTYGATSVPGSRAPAQISFVGRSSDGRRARWFIFPYRAAIPDDFRLSTSENADVLATYNALVAGAAAGDLATIGGLAPTILPYANVNYNSYYETKQRG